MNGTRMSSTPSLSDKSKDNSYPVAELHTDQINATRVEDVNLSAYAYTEEESRRIVRLFDWHILPFIWCEFCSKPRP